jgi:hypothetical protein
MVKEKDRVRRVDRRKEDIHMSENVQETSETSSFVFSGQMTKI